MSKMDVEATRECIRALGSIGKSIEEVLEDGKIGISDIGEIPSIFSSINTLTANYRQARAELGDLQQDEANLLAVEFMNALFSLEAV